MKKILCSNCFSRLPEDDFAWKIKGKYRERKCKSCKKAYDRNRHKNKKSKAKEPTPESKEFEAPGSTLELSHYSGKVKYSDLGLSKRLGDPSGSIVKKGELFWLLPTALKKIYNTPNEPITLGELKHAILVTATGSHSYDRHNNLLINLEERPRGVLHFRLCQKYLPGKKPWWVLAREKDLI
ncbi:MAG: hypothetical protein MI754_14920 [Chromatiales bacterium]|nr:hypothetical protein [Chromatiales bacterium]